jgi:hypothetical protein
VPLIATAEPRHVLVSTSFSKAALRVAADEAERWYGHVHYFPSYEIITSPVHEGRYWADDLRQVTELGVAHVMRVFSSHFLGLADADAGPAAGPALAPASGSVPQVVCDEEAIEAGLRRAGFGPAPA